MRQGTNLRSPRDGPSAIVPTPESLASRNPRLRQIHDRHQQFLAGLEDARPPLGRDSHLWEETMDNAMSVFTGEMTASEIVGRVADDTEQAHAFYGKQPPVRAPTAPQPTSVRRSLPGAVPIRAPNHILAGGEEFDSEHKTRVRTAHSSLTELVLPGGSILQQEARFYRRLEDLKRHRFTLREEVVVHARSKGPKANRKVDTGGAWKLEDSIWKERPTWADSKGFHDTAELYEKAFAIDWSRALRSHKLAKYIIKSDDGDGDDSGGEAGDDGDADGDGFEDSEIVEVGNALWKHHLALYRCFDAYAAFDSKVNISGITYNAFKDWAQDCDIPINGHRSCDSADLDRVFIKVNSKEIAMDDAASPGGAKSPPGRKLHKQQSLLTQDKAGRFGMAATKTHVDTDRRALCRHEWLNVIVRIAVMRYVTPGVCKDVSNAVDRLLTTDIAPRLEKWILWDTDGFRRDVCYTEAVDAALCEHKASVLNIIAFFSATEAEQNKKERATMSLSEWINMMRDLELLDDFFTLRDATMIFAASRMRARDEFGKKAYLKLETLSMEDCFEALVRVACQKAMPTDEEVETAQCLDGGDFIIRLRAEKAENEWLDQYYRTRINLNASRPDEIPPQPVHRALSHLLLYMIRQIEVFGSLEAKEKDLNVTKKELIMFSKMWIEKEH